MRYRLALLSVLLFGPLALPAAAGEARPATVVLDGSASMRGFVASGGMGAWVAKFREAARTEGFAVEDKVLISNRQGEVGFPPAGPWLANPTFGSLSPIEAAFTTNFPQSQWMFLLTDNVQTGHLAPGTEAFYEFFKRPEVGYVYALPLQLPFDGPLFLPREGLSADGLSRALRRDTPGGRFGKVVDNGTNLVVPYTGTRGAIMYAVAQQDQDPTVFINFLRRLKHDLDQDVLLIKPIDGRAFEIDGVEGVQEVASARAKFPPPADSAPPPLYAPTLRLTKTRGNTEQSAVLAPPDALHTPRIEPSKANTAVFYFGLKSRLEHIEIGSEADPWHSPVKLTLTPPEIRLGADPTYRAAGQGGDVFPSKLVGHLSAVGADDRARYIYMGKVSFGPFPRQWQWADVRTWSQAFQATPADLRFDLRLAVPPEALALDRQYAQRFFSPSLTAADRIYAPTDLVRYLAAGSLEIPLKIRMNEAAIPDQPGSARRVAWRFQLPADPTLVFFLAGFLGLLLTLVGSLARLFRPLQVRWSDGARQEARIIPFSQQNHPVTYDGAVVAHLASQGLTSVVMPADGYSWGDGTRSAREARGEHTIYQDSQPVDVLRIG